MSVGGRRIGTPAATSSSWQRSKAARHAESELDRRRCGRDRPIVADRPDPAGAQGDQARADAEIDPGLAVGLDGEAHDIAIEGARLSHATAEYDGVVEIADVAQAHGDGFVVLLGVAS